jgi:hypothetical protein
MIAAQCSGAGRRPIALGLREFWGARVGAFRPEKLSFSSASAPPRLSRGHARHSAQRRHSMPPATAHRAPAVLIFRASRIARLMAAASGGSTSPIYSAAVVLSREMRRYA